MATIERHGRARAVLRGSRLLAISLLSVALTWLAWRPQTPAVPTTAEPIFPASNPFDAAMEQAWQQWLRAHDGPAPAGVGTLWLGARGALHRARADALQALSLARSTFQECRARFLLAPIEHRAGDHRAELEHLQRLLQLKPQDREVWQELYQAAKCNGLEFLAQQAEARLRAFPKPSISRFPLSHGPVSGIHRLPDEGP